MKTLGLCAVILFVVASVSFSTQASAQTFEFKGVELGSHVDKGTMESKFGMKCETHPRLVITTCNGNTTFLGMDASELVSIDPQGKITFIRVTYNTTTVWPKDIAAELSKKFGAPRYNRQNMIFTWVNAKNEMAHLEHRELVFKVPQQRQAEPVGKVRKGDL